MCQFVEISNQMELNGEVWKFGYYNKSDFHCNNQSFWLRHLAPFDWKFLQIGTLVKSTTVVVVKLFLPVRWNLRVLLTKKDIWHFTCNRNAPFNGIIVTLIFGTIQGKTSYLSRIVAKNIFQISSLGAFMLQVTVYTLYILSDYETFFFV